MRNLKPTEWKTLRLAGNISIDGDVVEWETVRLDGVHHVVHEYANFVSSAEMVTKGQHLKKGFDPPVNTHLFHAFLLNCRKMADFFGGPSGRTQGADVFARDYVPGFAISLAHYACWRDPVDKQLAHITYIRDMNPREVTQQANLDMYDDLKQAWKTFRRQLSGSFAAKFELELKDKLKSESEFHDLDLL